MDIQQTLNLVNASVRDLDAYHLRPTPVRTKLNQNENPYDWPEDVKQELAAFCQERPWNRYPPFIPEDLKVALAEHVGWRSDGILVGNGSNEILLGLLIALMDRARPVVLCQPTFTIYSLMARALGGSTITVPLRENDLGFDVAAIRKTATSNPGSLVILCSPNNPTGGHLDRAEVESIVAAHQGIVVIDQAYVEFGGYDCVPLIDRYANLLVTRTFSKAFGGAGLRLGYLVGQPALVTEINKAKLPYNINSLTEYAARVMLRHRGCTEERVRELRASRESLETFLRSLPFDAVYPSVANFVLVRTSRKDEMLASLTRRGILVRDVSSYPMLDDCLRLSVGSQAENDLLKEALTAFFGAGTPT
jgi:histidinol-phosphate aminotransferase